MTIAKLSSMTLALTAGLLLAGGTAIAGGDYHKSAKEEMAQMDIVETAVSAGDFTTLATALDAAGLVSTLKGPGPFTVFAPTDAAFEALPEGTLESLLADKEKLATVLTYHVVSGKVMSGDVVNLNEAETGAGQSVKIDSSDGVKVNDATVIKADITASNGVIHVIDKVLIPE